MSSTSPGDLLCYSPTPKSQVWQLFPPLDFANGVLAYDKRDSFLLKFGPNAVSVLDRMDRTGASYGLRFNWEGRTGSSRDSHKLILLAAEQDAAASAAATISSFSSTSSSITAPAADNPSSNVAPPNDEMEKNLSPSPRASCPPIPGPGRYHNRNDTSHQPPSPMEIDAPNPFSSPNPKMRTLLHALLLHALTLGADISSRKTLLVPLALSHGLASSETDLLAQLDSPELNARVDAEMVRARREVGVMAVPSYVVNGRYRVGGWQEPGVFERLFERIRA